jgi:hypothetical protein
MYYGLGTILRILHEFLFQVILSASSETFITTIAVTNKGSEVTCP